MNLPNKLTCLRILLTFVFMFFLFLRGVASKYIALSVFLVASVTDFYDGHIARKTNQVTDFGKLMDPIADKILALAAFLAFVELKLVPAWMVVLIISRELIITGVRIVAVANGKVLAADSAGKHKTVSQMISILAILAYLAFRETAKNYFTFFTPALENRFEGLIFYIVLVTVILTLISGICYLWRNRYILLNDSPKFH